MAGPQPIAVQHAGNDVVGSDVDELADGGDDVGRGAVALTTPAPRQPQLGVDTARPVDQQYDLAGGFVEGGDDLLDHGADDALPEASVVGRRLPDGLQVIGQP